MPRPPNALLLEHEGTLQLALEAYRSGQFRSHRTAAQAFNVKRRTLSCCAEGLPFCIEAPSNCQKLTATEEQTIVKCILNLNLRGFALWLYKVLDIANKLLGVCGSKPVSKH
jgi:hypothetical protein